ncbi:RHS repeat domain-containing protein [Nonomuraea jabiensis]|uniref:RHS repeat-associated protein n=1 Tax=Nonomuraea jabiensis TaxID=882448 RepID=A0A7W9L8X5_9ACTN|nr:RHS repeat-associated core domain-containing protein [Nonomuraea jabiensis]MBB5774985.1 RHS repeat-associated protein [Nonomuraea jabiensis]
MSATLLAPMPVQAAGNQRPDPSNFDKVAIGKGVKVRDRKVDPALLATKPIPVPAWPGEASTETDLSTPTAARATAGTLPVSVKAVSPAARSQSSTPAPASGKIKITTHDRGVAQRAGLDGVLLSLTPLTGPGGQAEVSLDYAAVAAAYGGGYGARLRLVQLPACVLTTPNKSECRTPTTVPSANRPADKTVTATVTLPGAPATSPSTTATPPQPSSATASGAGTEAAAPSATSPRALAGPMVLAATAGPSSSQGDFKATSLAPSATWSSGGNTGDFTWSYPMRVPPVPGSLTPNVGISYSSGSVDGRTANTNNQPSWVGEGFELAPGFIERRYKPCQDDGEGTDLEKPGDLCWAYPNATITWNGKGGELIQTAPGSDVWKFKNDDGTRIEHLTDTATGNGDDNGEYWRLTTTNGTQYYFGKNRLPGWSSGKAETKSALTVPVFGNNSGEPCNNGSFADSWCQQAYRWNLDYVVDPADNAMAYYYQAEGNHYGRNLESTDDTPYDRGGWLDHIEYGLRSGSVYSAKPLARVDFAVAERCLPTETFDCAENKIDDDPRQWADVPWDQQCKNADGECEQVLSPAFFTRKRLTKVTSSVLKSDGTYRTVDSWSLDHLWGDADADKALLLKSITHTGHATGTPITLPPVTFNHVQLANRVDADGDDTPPFIKYRLGAVYDEAGGQIDINYSDPDCTPADLPAASTNTRRCFPVFWEHAGSVDPVRDWFHKYVVTQIIVSDRTTLAADMVTDYTYSGDAAWHFDDDDGLTKEKYKTWSTWRGYGQVTTKTGGGNGVGMKTESTALYLRGMHGDRASKDGSDTKTVTVDDGEGGTHTDHDGLEGFLLKTTTLDKAGGSIATKTVNTPWRHVSASRTRSWGTAEATLTGTATSRTWTALEGGQWRQTRIDNSYESTYGLRTQTADLGDTATAADDRCTRITYTTPNTTAWLINYVAREETVTVACTATPDRSKQVASDVRTYFDNAALGAAPSKGQATKTERLSAHNGTTASYQTVATTSYDSYGRATSATDSAGRTTTTAYTPATGLVTQVTTTSPPATSGDATTKQTSVQDLDPAWGLPVVTTDPADGRTDLTYDALGRLTQVWLPDRPKSQGLSASIEYSYSIKSGEVAAVGTRTLGKDGNYLPWSYTLMDGLLRPRQTQAPGPNGGRILTDTLYNELGKVERSHAAYYTTGAPQPALFKPMDGVESQIAYDYDGLGRVVAEKLLAGNGTGEEKWRTTTSYGGDRVHVDPPTGVTPTTVISDARGQVTERRQYKDDSPTGAYDATIYGYTPRGELAKVTDSAGNIWTYTYDQRGRQIESTDPDKGLTKSTYDDLDRKVTSTDARGKTIWTGYDGLSRVTETRDGSATGTQLTSLVYDTLRKGSLTSATRYVGGQPYVNRVDSYDSLGRATRTSVVIPAAESGLEGTYTFNTNYNTDGTLQSLTYPAAGGLAAEAVTYGYDELLRPTTMGSNLSTYVTGTTYTHTGKVEQYEVGSVADKKAWFTYTYQYGTQRLASSRVDRQGQTGIDRDAGYAYDQAGNITSITDVSAKGTDTQCFAYDYLRRLSEAWTEGDTTCTAAPAGSVIGGVQPYWHSYTYDATGNRTKETWHGLAGAADTVRTYTYPAAGQGQHRLSSVGQTGAAGARTDTFGYDQVGNTTTRKIGTNAAQTLTWDIESRLEKVADGTKTATFVYDANGNRLLRRDNSATTLYLPGGMELKRTSTATSATRYYTHGGATVAMRTSSGGVYFLAPDHQGTGQISINGNTQAIAQRRTLPFGGLRGSSGIWQGDHGFLGVGINDSTGLTHIGAREYDPATGRFISVDPVMAMTDPQGFNGYAYSSNNPVTWSDPTGLLPQMACASTCETGDSYYKPVPGGHQTGTVGGSSKTTYYPPATTGGGSSSGTSTGSGLAAVTPAVVPPPPPQAPGGFWDRVVGFVMGFSQATAPMMDNEPCEGQSLGNCFESTGIWVWGADPSSNAFSEGASVFGDGSKLGTAAGLAMIGPGGKGRLLGKADEAAAVVGKADDAADAATDAVKAAKVIRNPLNPESMRGASVEETLDLMKGDGWVKEPARAATGGGYVLRRGNPTILIENGDPAMRDIVHRGPYLKYQIGKQAVRIPLEGNPALGQ